MGRNPVRSCRLPRIHACQDSGHFSRTHLSTSSSRMKMKARWRGPLPRSRSAARSPFDTAPRANGLPFPVLRLCGRLSPLVRHMIHPAAQAPVAQLDSASVFGTEGYRFESCRAYSQRHKNEQLMAFFFCAFRIQCLGRAGCIQFRHLSLLVAARPGGCRCSSSAA